MNKLGIAAAFCACAFLLTACPTVPIYNVDGEQVTTPSGKRLSASQVRSAIITAGTSLGWQVRDDGPQRLQGALHLRNHVAAHDGALTVSS